MAKEIKIKGTTFVIGSKNFQGSPTTRNGIQGSIRVKGGRAVNGGTPTFEYVPHGGSKYFSVDMKELGRSSLTSDAEGLWEPKFYVNSAGNNARIVVKSYGTSDGTGPTPVNYRTYTYELSDTLGKAKVWSSGGEIYRESDIPAGNAGRYFRKGSPWVLSAPSDPNMDRVVVGYKLGTLPQGAYITSTTLNNKSPGETSPGTGRKEISRYGTGGWAQGGLTSAGIQSTSVNVPRGATAYYRINGSQKLWVASWGILNKSTTFSYRSRTYVLFEVYYIDVPKGMTL